MNPRSHTQALLAILAILAFPVTGVHAAMSATNTATPMMMATSGPAPVAGSRLSWRRGRMVLRNSELAGVHHGGRTLIFRGKRVAIALVAHAPRHPDMSFETGGLTNPTLCVSQGAQVTLEVMNMDYGPGMAHGLVITSAKPPYPARLRRHLPHVLADIPPLPPRSRARLQTARYAEQTVRFIAGRPGIYYYICPVPGHALAFRMYGRFIVYPAGLKTCPRSSKPDAHTATRPVTPSDSRRPS
ncbi:MAG: cupredoxin domain-containing protein [Acidiferrobacter sp.]